jgi:citrate lyase beta subunit
MTSLLLMARCGSRSDRQGWDVSWGSRAAALLYARSRLVMASCAAGLPGPIDGPSVDPDDIVGLGADLRHSVTLGFTGKLCLHPRQLRMTNAAFAPAPSKLAWARRVLAATRRSSTSVARVDGEMVGWKHIDAAQHTVARAALFDPAEAGLGEPLACRLRWHRDEPSERRTWRLDS